MFWLISNLLIIMLCIKDVVVGNMIGFVCFNFWFKEFFIFLVKLVGLVVSMFWEYIGGF